MLKLYATKLENPDIPLNFPLDSVQPINNETGRRSLVCMDGRTNA